MSGKSAPEITSSVVQHKCGSVSEGGLLGTKLTVNEDMTDMLKTYEHFVARVGVTKHNEAISEKILACS